MKIFLKYFLIVAFVPFLLNCTDNEVTIKKRLEIILADDLNSIVKDTRKDILMDKPYYTITEYKTFKKSKYSNKAVVDFIYLKKIKMKITRKYRYHMAEHKWERYYNMYHFINE